MKITTLNQIYDQQQILEGREISLELWLTKRLKKTITETRDEGDGETSDITDSQTIV